MSDQPGKHATEAARLRERACHMRRMARELSDDPAADALEQIASELEAKATKIELQRDPPLS